VSINEKYLTFFDFFVPNYTSYMTTHWIKLPKLRVKIKA